VALPLPKRMSEREDALRWGVPYLPASPTAIPLTARALGKSYGARTVLTNLDLTLAPGEFLGVVGRSGCGKSTLLRLLAGLETPDAGQISLGDVPLSGPNERARVMFQEPRLLPWKRVAANVALGLRGPDARQRARAALQQVGLDDRADEWPATLSGGQRQRVALARALASDPPLLLLDEPLSALDALTRREMQHLIERLQAQRGFSALLVTHDSEEAIALCDRVILLEEGRVAAEVVVPLPRPRARETTAFVTMKEELLARLLSLPTSVDI